MVSSPTRVASHLRKPDSFIVPEETEAPAAGEEAGSEIQDAPAESKAEDERKTGVIGWGAIMAAAAAALVVVLGKKKK